MLTAPSEVVLHRKAERDLQEAREKLSKQTKVLLLSSADSGKSEMLKQLLLMQILSYNVQEHEPFRPQVLKHLIRILSALDDLGLSLSDDNKRYAEHVQNDRDLDDWEPFPASLYYAFSFLWSDPTVQDVWKDRETYGFPESLSYFFSSLTRLFDIAYIPTEEDILNLGFQTTGDIIETTFRLLSDNLNVTIMWNALLFLVNLSGYDESVGEDPGANQLQDALHMWDMICNSEVFLEKPLILFLNNYKLFQNKIRTSHIVDYFPDYEGAIGDASEGMQYFTKLFSDTAQKCYQRKDRQVLIYATNSTDLGILRMCLLDITLGNYLRSRG